MSFELSVRRGVSRISAVFALCGLLSVPLLVGCGGSSDPFSYVKVSGTVKYPDGTPVVAPYVQLTFIPQDAKKPDEKTYPPAGHGDVKPDGSFDYITSGSTPGDGLLPGKHKVIVVLKDAKLIPLAILKPEYGDPTKTPLLVDTANPDSFNLKVEKGPPGKKK